MSNDLSNMDRYNIERQEQAENRKQYVLDIAQKLFLEKGLANTTMNDIMNEAGVSKATLYRYFDSIHPIAFEIQYRKISEIFSYTEIKVNDNMSNDDIIFHSLITLIDQFFEYEQAHRYVGMFDNMYSTEFPSEKLATEYHEFFAKMNSHVGRSISKSTLEYNKLITSMNVTLSFLQRLATRGKMLEKYQGITIDEQLNEFKKMIEREFERE